jgi:hypothetical protein
MQRPDTRRNSTAFPIIAEKTLAFPGASTHGVFGRLFQQHPATRSGVSGHL